MHTATTVFIIYKAVIFLDGKTGNVFQYFLVCRGISYIRFATSYTKVRLALARSSVRLYTCGRLYVNKKGISDKRQDAFGWFPAE